MNTRRRLAMKRVLVSSGTVVALVVAITFMRATVLAQDHSSSGRLGTVAQSSLAVPHASSDPVLFIQTANAASGGNDAQSVAVGDVNGDGKPDLIVANNAGTIGVLFGNGDGTLQKAVTYSTGATSARSVAVVDVNGDGKLDVIVGGAGVITVMPGNGDGTFGAPASFNAGGLGASLAVADVNGDGQPDVVVCGFGDVGMLLGNGDGTFHAMVTYSIGGDEQTGVVVADVNGDHHPDILVAYSNWYAGSGFLVLLGKGDGTFGPAVIYWANGLFPDAVGVGDLNGDGFPDVVLTNQCPGSYCADVAVVNVFLGNGDGTFQSPAKYMTNMERTGTLSLAVLDANGDGMPDLAVGSHALSFITILLNNGDGTFAASAETDSSGGVSSMTVGDVNGDHKPDLIVTNLTESYQMGLVGVLLNVSGPAAPTTTSITSSASNLVFGQEVTFRVEVTSTSGTPGGTVLLLNGTAPVGSGTLVGGSVVIPGFTLPAGRDSITASYRGGAGFSASKSAPLTETVTKAATRTSLGASLNPGVTNQSIILTATVGGQFSGAATGTVNFLAGSQSLGSAPLSGNIAALTISFATSTTYSITAHYSGDSNNTGSTSGALSEKIIASTTTTLTSSLNPSFAGHAVTFTATVTSPSGAPPNGETITFYNGNTVMGTAPLSAGVSMLTTSALAAGVFTITARYPGDSNFAASTSAALRQTVNATSKSATATTLLSTLNPSIYGQKVTFTARVTTSGPVPPTGTVVFMWKYYTTTYTIGTAPLNSAGVATLIKSNLNADPYPMIAVYRGDANNLSSTSAVLNQTVLQTTSAAALTSSANPSTVGQAITFTVKITSPAVIPSGPVTFKAGTTVLGTAQLNSGKAIFTTSTLPAGSTVLRVTYNGNSNIKGSSASLTQTVQP